MLLVELFSCSKDSNISKVFFLLLLDHRQKKRHEQPTCKITTTSRGNSSSCQLKLKPGMPPGRSRSTSIGGDTASSQSLKLSAPASPTNREHVDDSLKNPKVPTFLRMLY